MTKTCDDVLVGATLVAGRVSAELIVLAEPLSFWGGYDAETGLIIDRQHPLVGQCLAGKIIVMAHAKGSSSSSSVLAEAIRRGTGPAGIVLQERDLILSIGAIVAAELYDIHVPVVCLDAADFGRLVFERLASSSGRLRVDAPAAPGRARLVLDAEAA